MTDSASVPAAQPRHDQGRRGCLAPEVVLAVAFLLAAASLRPMAASVGPILPDIRAGAGLSGAATSVFTALPALCFGAIAPLAPKMARRLGVTRAIAATLLGLVLGQIIRVAPGIVALFSGTILAGGSVAVANVLLPAFVKDRFAAVSGTMMGLYTTALAASGALAAGVTIPLQSLIAVGWRGGLGIWMIPALVALVMWISATRGPARDVATNAPSTIKGSVLRDPLTWQIAVFFGLQSLGFYALLAWLPSVFQSHGIGAGTAGALLSVSIIVGLPAALTVPTLATRSSAQSLLIAAATVCTAAGLAGLIIAPTTVPYLWVVLVGIGQSAAFALALTILILRTRTAADTASLATVAQCIGYLLAATGPLAVGGLHAATGSWTPPLLLLSVLLIPQLLAGSLAGRSRFVKRTVGPGS